jgi:hypothetical protein
MLHRLKENAGELIRFRFGGKHFSRPGDEIKTIRIHIGPCTI